MINLLPRDEKFYDEIEQLGTSAANPSKQLLEVTRTFPASDMVWSSCGSFFFRPGRILAYRPNVAFRVSDGECLSTVLHRPYLYDNLRFCSESPRIRLLAILHDQVERRGHASANLSRSDIQMAKRTVVASRSHHHQTVVEAQFGVSHCAIGSFIKGVAFEAKRLLKPCNRCRRVLVSQAWYQH